MSSEGKKIRVVIEAVFDAKNEKVGVGAGGRNIADLQVELSGKLRDFLKGLYYVGDEDVKYVSVRVFDKAMCPLRLKRRGAKA